jgi:polysaccharide deacetylase family protein (PEP-CTERM system associated)
MPTAPGHEAPVMHLVKKTPGPIVVTVDLEDWFQVENARSAYPVATWDACDLRVSLYTRVLLDIFDYYNVRCTFFVLGWLAERCKSVVREIQARGHELASHGYGHQLTYELSREKLREDLYRSKSLLEDITGNRVLGYRAPSFSITDRLLETLRELDYVYDSSYNNTAVNKRYGKIEGQWHKSSAGRMMARNGIIELPVSNLKVDRFTLPWGGGGYFRFWPFFLFKWGVKRILSAQGSYLFYFHPWEMDSVQPKIRNIGITKRFRHRLNLVNTFHRINLLFSTFKQCRFIPCASFLEKG